MTPRTCRSGAGLLAAIVQQGAPRRPTKTGDYSKPPPPNVWRFPTTSNRMHRGHLSVVLSSFGMSFAPPLYFTAVNLTQDLPNHVTPLRGGRRARERLRMPDERRASTRAAETDDRNTFSDARVLRLHCSDLGGGRRARERLRMQDVRRARARAAETADRHTFSGAFIIRFRAPRFGGGRRARERLRMPDKRTERARAAETTDRHEETKTARP